MSSARRIIVFALMLAAFSGAWAIAHRAVLASASNDASQPEVWRIQLSVQGRSLTNARLATMGPMLLPRQLMLQVNCRGTGFSVRMESGQDHVQTYLWTQDTNRPYGRFQIGQEFWVAIPPAESNPEQPINETPPAEGAFLGSASGIETDATEIASLAAQLTTNLDRPDEIAEVLHRYVERKIAAEPTVNGSSVGAVECLANGAGDSAAKARLLVALLRHRKIPARLVTGLTLGKPGEQEPHVWAEAWIRDHWRPMCPFFHHFGRLPRTFVALAHSDLRTVRGQNVRDLLATYSATPTRLSPQAWEASSRWQKLFSRLSLARMGFTDLRVAEFLLLVPLACLLVICGRNLIGLPTIGILAPALMGLALRESSSPVEAAELVGVFLAVWAVLHFGERLRLPAAGLTAWGLGLVATGVLILILGGRMMAGDASMASWLALAAILILAEALCRADYDRRMLPSLLTMLASLAIAATIAGVSGIPVVRNLLIDYPELAGVILAGVLMVSVKSSQPLVDLLKPPTPGKQLAAELPAMSTRLRLPRF